MNQTQPAEHTHGLYIYRQGGKPHFTGSFEEVHALISDLTAAERARGWIIVPLLGEGTISPTPQPAKTGSWLWAITGCGIGVAAIFAIARIFSSGW